MAAGDFQDQVETLTSTTVTDTGGLTNLLTSGATEVINRIKKLSPGESDSFTAESTHAIAGGLTLGGASVVYVARESGTPGEFNAAMLIPPSKQYDAVDSSSLDFMSSFSPGYYIQADKVHLVPATSAVPGNSAKIVKITYPTIVFNDSAINNFPDSYEYLVILYSAFHHIMGVMQALTLPTASFPVVPETPTLVDKTILVPGALSLPPTPGGRDIDFTDLPNLPTYSSPVLTLTTISLPGDFSMSSSTPVLPAFTDTRIEFSSNAPVYTSPIFINLQDTRPSLTYGTFETDKAILYLPDLPTAPTTPTYSDLNDTTIILSEPELESTTLTDTELNDTILAQSTLEEIDARLEGVILEETILEDLGTAPSYTPPTAPVFEFSDVDYPTVIFDMPAAPIVPELESAVVQIDLGTLVAEFPGYLPPQSPALADFDTVSQILTEISLPSTVTPPAIVNVGEYPTGEFDWTLPSQPLPPVFNWAGLTQVLTAMELPPDPLFPTLEVQDVPAMTWDFPTAPLEPTLDWSGVTQVVSTVTTPAGIVIPSVEISTFPSISWSFPSNPVAQQADWEDLEKWINIEEDPEMAGVRISAIAERYAAYGSDVAAFSSLVNGEIAKNQGLITSWSEEVNAKLSKFTGELTGAIERYTGEASAEATIVNTQVSVLNAQIQQIAQKNNAAVTLFQSQITAYQSTINGIVTANQGRLQGWNQEWQTKLAKYQAEVSSVAQEYGSKTSGRSQAAQSQVAIAAGQLRQISDKASVELQEYTAETQAWQTRVDTVARRNNQIASNWQIEWNTKVQKFATELGALISLYEGEIRGKSAGSQTQIGIYQAQLAKVNGEAQTNNQLYQGRLTGAQNQFQASVDAYKTELDVLIKNADLATIKDGRALEKYSGELDAFNKEGAMVLAENTARIEEWVGRLTALTDVNFKEFQLEMSRYQSEIQDASNVFIKEQSLFEADLQHKLEKGKVSLQGNLAHNKNKLELNQNKLQETQMQLQRAMALNADTMARESLELNQTIERSKLGLQQETHRSNLSLQEEMERSKLRIQKEVEQAKFDDAKAARSVQIYQAEVQEYQVEIQAYNTKVQAYQAEVQSYGLEVQTTSNEASQAIQLWIEEVQTLTQKYSIDYQAWAGDYSASIQKYQADIQDSLNKYQEDVLEYQADLQISLKNVDMQEADNAHEMQRYQADLQNYQSTVQQETAEFQLNLKKLMDKWQVDISTDVGTFQANIQEEQAKFASEITLWQSEFGKATQKFQLESGYDMTEYQGSVQTAISEYGADIQRFGSDQQDISRKNQELMGSFQVELAKFQGESQVEQQRWTIEFQNANTEYQRLTATYSQLKQEYDGAFALMQPPQQQQERRR